jgi:hypothetical protein
MKQKSQFNGLVGLKMFSNIIYYIFKKKFSFGILKKIAHWSFFLIKMKIGQNDIKIERLLSILTRN